MSTHTLSTDSTRPAPAGSTDDGPTPWQHLVAMAVGLTAALCVLVIAFVWPATSIAPNEVPIVVAGPPAAAEQVQATLDGAHPGAFEVTAVADESAARAALQDRDAYGAIVLGQKPTVLTASAASPLVAQLLNQVASGLAGPGAAAPAVTVVDVVALPAGDPRGVGLAAMALPLVLGGLAVGAAMSRAVRGVARGAIGTIGVATLSGLSLAAIAHGWFGVLAGNYWAEAGAIALGIGSAALALVGLNAVFGIAGLGIGAATIMLLGNPLSGITSAPEMLPTPWGQLGQWLPPGAAGSLLRSVSFFGGAGGTGPVLILAGYAVGGLLLAWAGAQRASMRGRSSVDALAASTPEVQAAGA